MATVTIDDDHLVVRFKGLHRLWTFRSRLSVPLDDVRGATHDPGIAADHKGLRGPGVHLPGVLAAGTFHQDGDRIFWDVRDRSKAVVIELAGAEFTRLVVQVDNPHASVELIESARPRT